MKNQTSTVPVIITCRHQAEQVMHELAHSENQRRHLLAQLDAAILNVQQAASPGIAACDAEVKLKSEALRAWAESNPQEFGKGRRSIPLRCGTLGFRAGAPRLALLSRAFSWDAVMERIREKGWTGFIRTRTEPDKESLLAQRGCYKLSEVGLKVVQDETFYVEPKLAE
jgi:phage host-nuclease inhibitor protein Gam